MQRPAGREAGPHPSKRDPAREPDIAAVLRVLPASLQVTTRTVERDWQKARAWLYTRLQDPPT
jgi:hypothetical protein